MYRLKKYTLSILMVLSTLVAYTQEFNISVTVSAPANTLADPTLYKSLENEIEKFYNTQVWTDDTYDDHEKISGNIQLTIREELSPTTFKAEMVIQTSRPVFNSIYKSPIIRYNDKHVSFGYDGIRPLQPTKDGYIDAFSSLLSYYAYYMLGMDYDTFSKLGGDSHFENAFSIYNNLPSGVQSSPGWTIDDLSKQNRYYLIENIRNPRFRKFREALYNYHRHGLDVMYDDFETGRATMVDAVTEIGRVNREVNNTILPKMFSDTKKIELVDVFVVATPEQKTKVRSIMLSIDPSQGSAYKDLR